MNTYDIWYFRLHYHNSDYDRKAAPSGISHVAHERPDGRQIFQNLGGANYVAELVDIYRIAGAHSSCGPRGAP